MYKDYIEKTAEELTEEERRKAGREQLKQLRKMRKKKALSVLQGTAGVMTALTGKDMISKAYNNASGYIKRPPKEALNYIKNNPKVFKKDLGRVLLGANVIGLGALSTIDGAKGFQKARNFKSQEKEASSMNDFNEIEKTAKNRYMRYLDEAGSTGEMIRRMKKLKIKGATPNGLRRSMANEMGVNDTFGNKIIKSNFKQPEKMPSKLRMTINEYTPRDNNYDYPSKMLTKDSINRMQEMKHVMGLNTGSELYRGFNRSDKKLKELLNQTYKDRGRSGRLYALSRGTGLESKFIRRNFNDLRQNVQNGEPFRKLQKAENIAKRRKKIKRLPSNYTVLNEKAV